MADREDFDFVTAFAIGAALGVGAALLLRPGRQTRVDRIIKELKPYRKQAGKQAHRLKKELSRSAGAAVDSGEELVSNARGLLHDFRSEVNDIVADARKELGKAMKAQVKTARRAARRTAKQVRS
jgi:gas vesicle protein